MYSKKIKLSVIMLAVMIAVSFVPGISGNVNAAGKKPKTPKLTSVKTVSGKEGSSKTVKIQCKWKKAKGAKAYRLAYRLGKKGLWKTKKYGISKRSCNITIKKKSSKQTFYAKIRSERGKKHSKYSKTKSTKIPIIASNQNKQNVENKADKGRTNEGSDSFNKVFKESLQDSNINLNEYLNIYSAEPRHSFLSRAANNEIMRVDNIENADNDQTRCLAIQYYNQDYKLKNKFTIKPPLKSTIGFYNDGSNYYILSCSDNHKESDTKEVFRITKYDSEWKEISHCSIFGANTYAAGEFAQMTKAGKWLFVHTAHTMYKDKDDGLRHQGNVLFQIDTDTMKMTDASFGKGYSGPYYVAHSFSQYVMTDKDRLIALNQSDAVPSRAVVLFHGLFDYTDGKAFKPKNKLEKVNGMNAVINVANTRNSVLKYPGRPGNNYTGVCLGGLEQTATSYIIVGNSINLDRKTLPDPEYDDITEEELNKPRNIWVAAVKKEGAPILNSNTLDLELPDCTTKYITNYKKTKEIAGNPYIVKIEENKLLLIWRIKDKICYCSLDQDGKQNSKIYTFKGYLSDCNPIIVNNKIVWYTWEYNNKTTFYEIDINDLSEIRTVKNY